MSLIKKFFKKKKLDVKFKKAGEGHKLDTGSSKSPPAGVSRSLSSGSQGAHGGTHAKTDATMRAADAAAKRIDQSKTVDNEHMLYLKARVKKELEAEKKSQDASASNTNYESEEVVLESSPIVSQILFKCPDIGPAVLPRHEMEAYIEEFLLKQLADEPEMTSALMIHTLNKNKESVKMCVETLQKYLENIIAHPGEEKYCKIRLTNKVYQDKISPLKGTDEFLQSIGFMQRRLPFEDREDNFYVIDSDASKDTNRFVSIKEVLLAAEPIKPQLDRCLKIFHPSSVPTKFTIPDDFYNITPDELKREQQRRSEATEKLGMLRTKAMRERDEMRQLRKYRYTLIRVRLPNDVMIQGMFKAGEAVSAVYEYIRENIVNDWMPFELLSSTGHKLKEEESITLAEAAFVPAALVNFAWNEAIMKEVAAQQGIQQNNEILKPEVMALIEKL